MCWMAPLSRRLVLNTHLDSSSLFSSCRSKSLSSPLSMPSGVSSSKGLAKTSSGSIKSTSAVLQDDAMISIHRCRVYPGWQRLFMRGFRFRSILGGAIHSTKFSGLRFEYFLGANGSRWGRTVSFHFPVQLNLWISDRFRLTTGRVCLPIVGLAEIERYREVK